VAAPNARFDARLVDPRFERSVAEFSRSLRSARNADAGVELRNTVRLLAIAMQRVPYAGRVDVEQAAASIRGGRTRARSTPFVAFAETARSESNETLHVEQALQVVAGTFVELARGPYSGATGIIGDAYAFDATVREIGSAGRESRRCGQVVRALDQAEKVLLRMRAAIGRGEVGPMSDAPPPVAWER